MTSSQLSASSVRTFEFGSLGGVGGSGSSCGPAITAIDQRTQLPQPHRPFYIHSRPTLLCTATLLYNATASCVAHELVPLYIFVFKSFENISFHSKSNGIEIEIIVWNASSGHNPQCTPPAHPQQPHTQTARASLGERTPSAASTPCCMDSSSSSSPVQITARPHAVIAVDCDAACCQRPPAYI
eukprot:SAG25_NODE_381_length_8805_cov_1.882610_3_plen_184_part_00